MIAKDSPYSNLENERKLNKEKTAKFHNLASTILSLFGAQLGRIKMLSLIIAKLWSKRIYLITLFSSEACPLSDGFGLLETHMIIL